MLRFKICLLGEPGVGKTSLAVRKAHRLFSSLYLSTVGVRIDRCALQVPALPSGLELLIWDLAGGFENRALFRSYLAGAQGVALVADLSRPRTLERLIEYLAFTRETLGDLPMAVFLNKCDLQERARWPEAPLACAHALLPGLRVTETSAKDGHGVDAAFEALVMEIWWARHERDAALGTERSA